MDTKILIVCNNDELKNELRRALEKVPLNVIEESKIFATTSITSFLDPPGYKHSKDIIENLRTFDKKHKKR